VLELAGVREAAGLVTETTWHHTQTVQWEDDGSVMLLFQVDGLEEIARWLLGWSGWVQVVRPDMLRAMVVEQSYRALALNGAHAELEIRAAQKPLPGEKANRSIVPRKVKQS
jgi:predicted DNA-binding transcriptional regulator YafY